MYCIVLYRIERTNEQRSSKLIANLKTTADRLYVVSNDFDAVDDSLIKAIARECCNARGNLSSCLRRRDMTIRSYADRQPGSRYALRTVRIGAGRMKRAMTPRYRD